jgi:Tfp pilus assembly protein PilF
MSEPRLAREQFQIAISLGVASEFEAHARYRISLNYFRAGAFAQAKYNLEKIIQSDHADTLGLPRRSVYEQLYRTCMELGDAESSEKYHRLSTSA